MKSFFSKLGIKKKFLNLKKMISHSIKSENISVHKC